MTNFTNWITKLLVIAGIVRASIKPAAIAVALVATVWVVLYLIATWWDHR